jgi:hypothetical protein
MDDFREQQLELGLSMSVVLASPGFVSVLNRNDFLFMLQATGLSIL